MTEPTNTLRLYEDLAWLWPMWNSPDEYADYCDQVVNFGSRLIAISSVSSIYKFGERH